MHRHIDSTADTHNSINNVSNNSTLNHIHEQSSLGAAHDSALQLHTVSFDDGHDVRPSHVGAAAAAALATTTHTLHVKPAEEDDADQSSPSCLHHFPLLRPFLYTTFLTLATSNLVLGIQSIGPSCKELSWYAVCVGVACGLSVGGVWRYYSLKDTAGASTISPQPISFLTRLLHAFSSLIFLLLILLSCVAIYELSDNSCPSKRDLRQIVLFDIILILGGGINIFLYSFLSYHFPDFKWTSFTRYAGKSIILWLCFLAFLTCVLNLSSHSPKGRMVYHYGYSAREHRCPVGCNSPTYAPTDIIRTVKCYDADGLEVEKQRCKDTVPTEEPLTSLLLLPCPSLSCEINKEVHWTLRWENEPLTTNTEEVPSQPINDLCSDEGASDDTTSDVKLILYCYSDITKGWLNDKFCTNITIPAPYAKTDRSSPHAYSPVPPKPCRQACQQLYWSAVGHAVVFGVITVALLATMCLCKRKKTEGSRSALQQQQQLQQASSDSIDPTSSSSSRISRSPIIFTTSSPSQQQHAATLASSSMCSLFCTLLYRLALLVFNLIRGVFMLPVWTTRAAAPWWRHFIVIGVFLGLLALMSLAFFNLMWLVNAHCRDFSVSAIMNSCVTFVLAIVMIHVVIRNRGKVWKKEENVFETIGLLTSEEEEAAAADGDANQNAL